MQEVHTSITKNQRQEIIFSCKCADEKYKQLHNFARFAINENDAKADIAGLWQEVGTTWIIKDQGIGIPENGAPFIVNQFFRSKSAEAHQGPGGWSKHL
jgi:signal transduction histidine kinase